MGTAWKSAAGALSVAVAALALSACSSSPAKHHATHARTTTSRPPASTTTSSTPTSSATSSSTTTTTAAAGIAKCNVSGLRIAVSGQGGAAGTQETTFSMTNTSSAPCSTYGYPGLLLVTTAGAALTTTVVRGGGLAFENIAPATVTLGAGAVAYFNVGFSDVQTGTTTCSSTHTIEVTPPTNTAHATVDVARGIYACDNGTLHVSAVFSSTNASATQTTAPPS